MPLVNIKFRFSLMPSEITSYRDRLSSIGDCFYQPLFPSRNQAITRM